MLECSHFRISDYSVFTDTSSKEKLIVSLKSLTEEEMSVNEYLHLMSPNYQRPTHVALDNALIFHLHITTCKIYQDIVDQNIDKYLLY